MRCLFRASTRCGWPHETICSLLAQDVGGHRTTCSLLFVKLPWIRDVYEHESFITQPQRTKTYELLFNKI